MEQKPYKHFLTYDQDVFDGILHGPTEMYYYISYKTLHIKRVGQSNEEPVEAIFSIAEEEEVYLILENFLIDYMSYTKNFVGYPLYVKSALFSEEDFDKIREKGINKLQQRNIAYIEEAKSNELIAYCKSINLHPEPAGSGPSNWIANCLSGGKHHLFISLTNNTWGCGYCKKKGSLEDLKEWYNSANR